MKKINLILATGFGIGYFPIAPGTWGSVEGLFFSWLLSHSFPWVQIAVIVLSIFISVWISTEVEKSSGASDPGYIVIDEVLGMMVTLLFIPLTWKTLIAGFFLFRLLDIWKPFPIRLCQDRLPAGWGVMMDDIAAGIVANLVLRIGMRV